MSTKHFLYLLCFMAFLPGCKHYGVLVKRESELNCPTDIRKTVPWCAGEDAIFRCPTGPNEQFHGHKPTCWRLWETSGEEWRDLHCKPICSTCETGHPGSLPVGQVHQSIEVVAPTKLGPVMPVPDNGQQAPHLNNPSIGDDEPSIGDDESLPEPEEAPQQIEAPSDATSFRVRPQLLWEQKAAISTSPSLTDYLHQSDDHPTNQAASRLIAHEALSQAKTELSPLPGVEVEPERLVLLPPVESVRSKTVTNEKPTIRKTVFTEEPTKSVPMCINELSIVPADAEKPSTKDSIRLITIETPKKAASFKKTHSSKMRFAR